MYAQRMQEYQEEIRKYRNKDAENGRKREQYDEDKETEEGREKLRKKMKQDQEICSREQFRVATGETGQLYDGRRKRRRAHDVETVRRWRLIAFIVGTVQLWRRYVVSVDAFSAPKQMVLCFLVILFVNVSLQHGIDVHFGTSVAHCGRLGERPCATRGIFGEDGV